MRPADIGLKRNNGESEMSPEEKQLVQSTWAQVIPIADQAADMFYNRLFQIDPSTRPLFAKSDLAEQRKKLVQVLGTAVNGLDHLETLLPVVEELGRRHAGYGVLERHYGSVGEALLSTLEDGLGEAWSPAAAAAWTKTYDVLSSVMMSAARAGQAASAKSA